MKKLLVLLAFIIDIATVVILAMNKFFTAWPEWLPITMMAIVGGIAVVCFVRGKRFISIINILLIIVVYAFVYMNPYWNATNYYLNNGGDALTYLDTIPSEEAVEDFEYAMKYIKKIHPLCIDGLTPEMEASYKEALVSLKNADRVSVNELREQIEIVMHPLLDGHTCVYSKNSNYHYLKDIQNFNDNSLAVKEINGIAVEVFFEEKAYLYSYDSDITLRDEMTGDFTRIEGLEYLGIDTEKGVIYTLEDKDGNRSKREYSKDDFMVYEEYAKYNHLEDASKEEEETSFVSYEIDKDADLAILCLNKCNYTDEYIDCVKEMFTEIKKQGIKNVAVDLRYNGGGHSGVATEFIRYLDVDEYLEWGSEIRYGWYIYKSKLHSRKNQKYDDLLFTGDVYLLTSNDTYSAAMDFAEYIKDNNLGKIIGQPSGNNPSACGDIAFLKLQNSGMTMQVSIKKWHRIDESKEGELIEPDIDCYENEAIEYLYEAIKK